MKASLLLITYKHEAFIAEAIRSAMAQDYPDIELVICDDGSSDRTVEILKKELENCPPHISVTLTNTEENLGFHTNINRGLAACTGDVIVLMSGDDVSQPDRMSKICKVFSDDPDCMVVCSNWIRIDPTGKKIGTSYKLQVDATFPKSTPNFDIYSGAPVCGATGAYRAEILNRFPPMQKGTHAEDNCFWFRAKLLGNIHYIAEPLVLWRSHSANQSNWTRQTDSAATRKKHLNFVHFHQCMAQQWRRDLSHALETDLITKEDYEQHELVVSMNREWARLIRLSITPAPWRLWLGSARRLLRTSKKCGLLKRSLRKIRKKHLKIRLFTARREKYWSDYFDEKPS